MRFSEFCSETAVTMYFWQLIPQIARQLGVPSWEYLAVHEQLDGIDVRSRSVGAALREYLKFYSEWAAEERAGRGASQQWARTSAAREALMSAMPKAASGRRGKEPEKRAKKSKRRR